jgi:hypothetical protein
MDHASRYNCVQKNQLDTQLLLGIFREPLYVSGRIWAHHREVNRMYTTIGAYYSLLQFNQHN